MSKKILITGGAGFITHHVIDNISLQLIGKSLP